MQVGVISLPNLPDFSPRGVSPELTTFVSPGSNESASRVLQLSYSPSSSKRPTTRIDISLRFPGTYVDVSGRTVVHGTALAKLYMVVPDSFSSAERVSFIETFVNALNDQGIAAYVKQLDPFWG